METKIKTFYSKRTWLNNEDSPSTGSIMCFDGIEIDKDGKEYPLRKINITDCFQTIKLHQAHYDTDEDFYNKVVLLRDEINEFIEHLEFKLNNR